MNATFLAGGSGRLMLQARRPWLDRRPAVVHPHEIRAQAQVMFPK